ncbi:COMM domain-containing protein 4-like [Sylvia borin]
MVPSRKSGLCGGSADQGAAATWWGGGSAAGGACRARCELWAPLSPKRFRVCGDLGCPDWVMDEISTGRISTLAKIRLPPAAGPLLTAVEAKCFIATMYDKIPKLTLDAQLVSRDVKATIAVLSIILSSAAKHSVDGESLSGELQQLGLPKGLKQAQTLTFSEKPEKGHGKRLPH